MRNISLTLALVLLLTPLMHALDIARKYPSAPYVLKEFDIDPVYLQDRWFQSFVAKNERKYRRFYENSARRGERYIPMFKELLEQGGLSHLFVYMSMTESGFRTDAKSSKHAVGLWQFMSATARRFSLKVDDQVDQRYDPVASTEAAMRYIQTLYRMFGKWYLVMMAYNCGEGRLQKAIQKAGSDDFALLMDPKAAYLPAETRNYLRKIILLSMMGEKIKSSPEVADKKIRQQILPDSEILVNVYGGTSLEKIARLIDVNPGELARLNPHIRGGVIPDEVSMTQIFIPVEKLARFQAFYRPPLLKELFKKRHYSHLVSHVVRKGDTIKSVARTYHSTPLDIIIANSLRREELKPGRLLVVPVDEKTFDRLSRF